MPLELRGESGARERAAELLDRVGLGDRLDHYPVQLSGGEQQRVGLARAFIHRPRILFADEPTGNLDGETGASIIETLFDLSAQRETTLLLITHDPAIAARCSRVVHLCDGQIFDHDVPA